jgi:hypothetical protein
MDASTWTMSVNMMRGEGGRERERERKGTMTHYANDKTNEFQFNRKLYIKKTIV